MLWLGLRVGRDVLWTRLCVSWHVSYQIFLLIVIQRRRMMQVRAVMNRSRRIYYCLINRLALHRKMRWTATLALLIPYFQTAQAPHHIVTYLIAFYLLHLLLSYLTPRGVDNNLDQQQQDSSLYSIDDQICVQTGRRVEGAADEETLGLNHEGDKPLARSLSEMDIWERTTLAFGMGLVCIYSKMLQLDVFWPILLVYLVVLACLTLQKIIKTMKKYKYGLADFQKQPF